ncbi:MAG: ATP-binding cassette domain-containing protein [Microthrixaceae bacterium]
MLENLRAAADLDEASAARLLDDVALDESFLGRRARDLSGGEQQRVCLARTLATARKRCWSTRGPRRWTGAQREPSRLLVSGLAHRGTPVLWVTHDLAQANRIADHRRTMGDQR